MEHMEEFQIMGVLALVLVCAKLAGAAARAIGQPAVLGELAAGVLLGVSFLGLVTPKNEVVHFLAEVGVVVLLFEIGLETDLARLLRVGGASAAVALAGVVLPFGLGYGVCRALGHDNLVAVVAGATLTATSVGITARVLSDLGRLGEPESQVILGAAVIDDILGLIILVVVSRLTAGAEVTVAGVAGVTAAAFGFVIVTLVLGSLLVPLLMRGTRLVESPGLPTVLAAAAAFALAWLAHAAGSAMIIGSFAAGLLMRKSSMAHQIETGARHLGYVFAPIFFVVVGSAVDMSVFNPFQAANHATLLVAGLLLAAAVAGKLAAGYAPFWFAGSKTVIGIGMIPRGEVGLIFAKEGLSNGVFDAGFFSVMTLVVMATTFLAPPLLRFWFPPPSESSAPAGQEEGRAK